MSNAAPDRAPDPAPDPLQDRPLDRDHAGRPGKRAGRHARAVWVVGDAEADADAVDAEPTFPHKPFLRTGYDRHAVDELVTKVALAAHNERQTSVSADDVARTRFPGRRFGPGYRMREVDDYLGAVEALLRTRATTRRAGADVEPADAVGARHHRDHHPTWWIYGVALVLVVVIVVFTVTQT